MNVTTLMLATKGDLPGSPLDNRANHAKLTIRPTYLPAFLFPGLATALAILSVTNSARAQDAPLRLNNISPTGVQTRLTERGGYLGYGVTNLSQQDREARLMSYYAGIPGLQFGADSWLPAGATLRSGFGIGSPPPGQRPRTIELKSVLTDRTRGMEGLLRSRQGPLHSHPLIIEVPQPGTALMVDTDLPEDGMDAEATEANSLQLGDSPSRLSEKGAREIRALVHVFREYSGLLERLTSIREYFLPPEPEDFDAIDHFVLASDRLASDMAGLRALRAWVERGGTLWVMIDRVGQATLAGLTGDALDVQIVDRTSLTRVHFRNGPLTRYRLEPPPSDMEEPVDFVRVLAPHWVPMYTIDGWPAALKTELGRGRIVFTTLGARAWMRPRTPRDRPSRYPEFPNLPAATVPFEFLSSELHQPSPRAPVAEADLHSYVSEQVSYSVIGRPLMLSVFGVFFLVLACATFILARKGMLAHLGWLGPLLAVGLATVFIGLGERRRGALPATLAVAQIVDAIPGLDEVQANGVLALYLPSLTDAPMGAQNGGTFELDLAGLEGRILRHVQTDMDRWHWENLELPAGLRTAPFRKTVRTQAPVEATARFGPEGIEGRLAAGPFRQLEDPLIWTPGEHVMALRLDGDGAFRTGSGDELYGGQMLQSSLLTDRQRVHQSLYQKFLADPQPRHLAERSMLLAWADPVSMDFSFGTIDRTTGAALLTVPLQFEKTAAGTPVTIPAAFVPCQRINAEGRPTAATVESRYPSTVRLRFQVPASVLPLAVQSAKLTVKMRAPAHEVTIGVFSGKDIVPVRELSSPLDAYQIDIDDPRLLKLDDRGALDVNIQVAQLGAAKTQPEIWRLESVGLEIRGRTEAKER